MPFDVIIGRNESDKKDFGKKGLAYLGKTYVTMGNYTSLSNPIYMDIARSHVILISGKRGSGKCLHEDSLVSLGDGSQVAIKYLADKSEKVVSMDSNMKMRLSDRSEFFSREVNKLLKVRLRSGKEIKLTPEHPLFTVNGWVPIGKLEVGSRIATPRKMPCFGNFRMKESEVKLLSYLIAEGHTKKVVLFSNMDEEIVNDFRRALKNFDSSLNLVKEKEGHYRISDLNWKTNVLEHDLSRTNKGQFTKGSKNVLEKRSIRKLIERGGIFGKLATEKFLSENLLKLGRKQMILFLNRLFSCDGSIYKSNNYWEVSYSSSSEKLIRQVQSLLLRFSILSKLREKQVKCNGKTFVSFELVLNSINAAKFINQIGFFGKKASRAEVAIEEIKLFSKNPNVDTIPKEIWDEYSPTSWTDIGRKLGYKHPKAMKERIHYCPSRATLMKVGEADSNNKFKMLAESDIFWDEITSIEVLDGKFSVYDICVPDNHNFVANDIIVHNSYTIGVIAEALSTLSVEESGNIAPLIFDTMGIFWTMKYKNEKDQELLNEWDLKAKNIPIKVFAPFGYYQEYRDKGIEVDAEFAIKISELESMDWVTLFELKFTDPIAVVIESVISKLRETKKSFSFKDIYNLIRQAENVGQEVKNSAMALFDAAKTWKVFDEVKGTSVQDMISAGQTTVIDLSMYASLGTFNVRALIIGLVSKKIFNERMMARKNEEIQAIQHGADYSRYKIVREMPLVWIFIDECLVGDTKISTLEGDVLIEEVVKRFEKGKEFRVLGFNKGKKEYKYYNVLDVFRKGKRDIIKVISETGRELKCTPEHRVLTRDGFASAFSVDEIASSLVRGYSEDKRIIVARILGHLFGDGWVSDKTKTLGFSGKGNKDDLEKIRSDLKTLGFRSSNIFERKTNSKINHKGKSHIVNGVSQSFASTSAYKFFRGKVDFAGEKVLQKITIPKCILQGSVEEKAEFLAALMGADGQIISHAKNAKGDFNAIRFSFNKIESLEEKALEYAKQVINLFEDIGVKISKVIKKEGNLRKDGHRTFKFVITLRKNVENTIKFLDKIGYRYCFKKEREGKKWLAYLRARLFLKREREKVKKNALELHKTGIGKTRIAKQLNFPEAQIRDWIYMGTSPGLPKSFLDFDEWIANRIRGDILFEKIFKIEEAGKEEVYDISVDDVHNFIANGFISHNCHEFLPREGKTPATDALIQLLREGRQPGISVIMATQQPGKIHSDAMSQSDIVISHRVTARLDVDALNDISQSYLYETISSKLNELPRLKGSAIILDDNSERIYPTRIRPRFTWHGGEAPTAIKKIDEEL